MRGFITLASDMKFGRKGGCKPRPSGRKCSRFLAGVRMEILVASVRSKCFLNLHAKLRSHVACYVVLHLYVSGDSTNGREEATRDHEGGKRDEAIMCGASLIFASGITLCASQSVGGTAGYASGESLDASLRQQVTGPRGYAISLPVSFL